MTYRVLRVDDPMGEYLGLKRIGGVKKLYDSMVTSNFGGWESFYDVRQSAILDASPKLFDARDRSPQFHMLKDHYGLRPEHRYLDYGCGPVAAGQHFIKYLNDSCYVGMDVSEKAIKIGRERLNSPELAIKKPELHHIENGKIPELPENSFDAAGAMSVFTHCPPEVVVNIIKYIKRILRKNGLFVASFTASDQDIIFQGYHNFYYPDSFMAEICHKMDLAFFISLDPSFNPAHKSPRLLGVPKNIVIIKK